MVTLEAEEVASEVDMVGVVSEVAEADFRLCLLT